MNYIGSSQPFELEIGRRKLEIVPTTTTGGAEGFSATPL